MATRVSNRVSNTGKCVEEGKFYLISVPIASRTETWMKFHNQIIRVSKNSASSMGFTISVENTDYNIPASWLSEVDVSFLTKLTEKLVAQAEERGREFGLELFQSEIRNMLANTVADRMRSSKKMEEMLSGLHSSFESLERKLSSQSRSLHDNVATVARNVASVESSIKKVEKEAAEKEAAGPRLVKAYRELPEDEEPQYRRKFKTKYRSRRPIYRKKQGLRWYHIFSASAISSAATFGVYYVSQHWDMLSTLF